MTNGITPNIDLQGRISASKIFDGEFQPTRLKSIEEAETGDFKTVFSGLIENLNNEANAPDEVLNQAMLGQADIHDVMTAIQKADIQVNLATTVVGKIIQAYEKVSQISI